jgi:hypothetical protein
VSRIAPRPEAAAAPRARRLFAFPNPVDEVSARLVATGVVLQAVVFLTVREWWLLIPLVYGLQPACSVAPGSAHSGCS